MQQHRGFRNNTMVKNNQRKEFNGENPNLGATMEVRTDNHQKDSFKDFQEKVVLLIYRRLTVDRLNITSLQHMMV